MLPGPQKKPTNDESIALYRRRLYEFQYIAHSKAMRAQLADKSDLVFLQRFSHLLRMIFCRKLSLGVTKSPSRIIRLATVAAECHSRFL